MRKHIAVIFLLATLVLLAGCGKKPAAELPAVDVTRVVEPDFLEEQNLRQEQAIIEATADEADTKTYRAVLTRRADELKAWQQAVQNNPDLSQEQKQALLITLRGWSNEVETLLHAVLH